MGLLRLGFLANFLSHPVVVRVHHGGGGADRGRAGGPAARHQDARREPAGDHRARCCPISARSSPSRRRSGSPRWSSCCGRARTEAADGAFGLGDRPADIVAKVAPAMAIVASTAAWGFGLDARGVASSARCRPACRRSALPPVDVALWTKLVVPSLLICIVGYVESISVALTLAAKRRQRVDPDQELIALGVADVGSAVSGGFPVTGGLSRSVVNFDAGAQTPAAGAFTAIGVGHRDAVPHAVALLPAEGGAGGDHHRRRPVAGGLRRAQAHLGRTRAPSLRRWPRRSSSPGWTASRRA